MTDLRELEFCLLWFQHGGSGLNVSKADVEEMDLEEAEWWTDRIADERKRESAAIKAQARRR